MSDGKVSCTALAIRNPSFRSSSSSSRLQSFLKLLQDLHVCSSLVARCRVPRTCPRNDNRTSKIGQNMPCVFTIFTSKRASGHGVHFFNISTSKNGVVCFQHLAFQKCSATDVLFAVALRHVLRSTTASTFRAPQRASVL